MQVRAKDFRTPEPAPFWDVEFHGDAGENTIHDGGASAFEELAVNSAGAGRSESDLEAVLQLLDDGLDRLGSAAATQDGVVTTSHGRRRSLKISA